MANFESSEMKVVVIDSVREESWDKIIDLEVVVERLKKNIP